MAADLFQLVGKKALIVGGGLGMGKASSELLASVGARVAVLDVVESRARTVASSINERAGEALPLVADALDPIAVQGAVQTAAEQLGGLDILVNIVGQAGWASALEMSADGWDLDQHRNLRYVFFTCQAFARLPAPTEGTRAIVNIASISGMNSAPSHPSYGAAKAGLMSLTRTMAQEWGRLGIRVNCIAPGSIRTDRSQGSEAVRRMMQDYAPLGRQGEQTEIAKAVLFLVSDLASYVTGVTLLVDGGVETNYAFPLQRR
jgi:NAD(P)-dependent dehydrogenase (short-subunit alcohol dehydrogenase family)